MSVETNLQMATKQHNFLLLLFQISLLLPKEIYSGVIVNKLSGEELYKFLSWNVGDKQNIWELSGQFEGDIINVLTNHKNVIIDETKRWKNKVISYEFDPNFPESGREYVDEVVKFISDLSCLKLRRKNENDTDYVYVQNLQTGCYSFVGRHGGKQILNLSGDKKGEKCIFKDVIVHEFLHAAGLHHQQSSTNRDDYIDIYWDNIEDGKEYNFEKLTENEITDFKIPYDYESIMHYSEYAFSKNDKPTIVPKKDNVKLGKHGVSNFDIAKLNNLYKC